MAIQEKKQQDQQNQTEQNNLLNEAARVEFATRAGGMKTRSLVQQGEEMLKNANTPSNKW